MSPSLLTDYLITECLITECLKPERPGSLRKDVIIFAMKRLSMKRVFTTAGLALTLLLLALASALLSTPAAAQVLYYTPTAEENGAIYYTVKEKDTCDSIALLNNISVDKLRELNGLGFDQCAALQIGQKLLLGTAPTQVITAGPSPTPTAILPTPEPVQGFGTICIYLYDDVNGDAIAQPGETTNTGIIGGKVSLAQTEGKYSNVGTTLNTGEPICFENIPEGDYNISMAIPEGFNPTSAQNYTITLKAGDTSTVNFSAQISGSAANKPQQGGSDSGGSTLLVVLGGVILLAGIGVGLYARYVLRAK